MFCSKCGARCDSDAKFCVACGAPLASEQENAPQTPTSEETVNFAPDCEACAPQTAAAPSAFGGVARKIVSVVSKNISFVLAGFALLAFVLGILNLFCILHVPATVRMEYDGDVEKETEYVSISDVAEAYDEMDKSFAFGIITNVIYGIINLAVAAIGGLFFAKKMFGLPVYDKFVARWLFGLDPALVMGVCGAGSVLLQTIFYAFCTVSEKQSFFGMKMSISMSIGTPWLGWVGFALFLLLTGFAVLRMLVKKNKI